MREIDPLLDLTTKGYPASQAPRRVSDIGAAGWNVLAGDLPLPIALLKREALENNILWMQSSADRWGVGLAPHGKTTMSPQLFQRQLQAGAWGMTVANATQLQTAIRAGAARVIIANQVVDRRDLEAIQQVLQKDSHLRVIFLVDSEAQVDLIEAFAADCEAFRPLEVMIELGIEGGRTGCRTVEGGAALARRVHRSSALRLVGIECFEGFGATGNSEKDAAFVAELMDRMEALGAHCAREGLFDSVDVLISAGGSSIFDLVAQRLRLVLGLKMEGVLRSGCYVTHDHGMYERMLNAVDERLHTSCASLKPAMEVWATVQSCPESGLAIVAVGKRDLSFDIELPVPIARSPRASREIFPVPSSWRITALNDQHAYLRWDSSDVLTAPVVGERIGLGISHPCTTFDKWQWMPIVESDYRVSDAISIQF